jgi:fructokinase
MKIVSIGEVLWDVIGDKAHLGGATFNFSAHARKLGHEVYFVSAVGRDARGDRVMERMLQMGLSARFVRRDDNFPTGIASVTLNANGQPAFRIERPAAYDFPALTERDLNDLLQPVPDWIYFGTLHQISPQARDVTNRLLAAKCGARHFYDVNLRPACYEPQLVRDLMAQATVVKLNDEEVPVVDQMCGRSHRTLEEFCRDYASRLGWEAVCVTRGAVGCALLLGDEFVEASGYGVTVVDAVGAGDAFAAAFLHGLGRGWPASRVADFANKVGALITSRPGAVPPWTHEEVENLAS